jgi:hypothetical protein
MLAVLNMVSNVIISVVIDKVVISIVARSLPLELTPVKSSTWVSSIIAQKKLG